MMMDRNAECSSWRRRIAACVQIGAGDCSAGAQAYRSAWQLSGRAKVGSAIYLRMRGSAGLADAGSDLPAPGRAAAPAASVQSGEPPHCGQRPQRRHALGRGLDTAGGDVTEGDRSLAPVQQLETA